jgi:hypothetical protein
LTHLDSIVQLTLTGSGLFSKGHSNSKKGIKMIRNLKVLGLAVVAVLALTAVMSSAASAALYTASAYPATATGANTKGSEVFTTEGGKVECDSHFVTHSISAASATITATPTYSNCEAFGFLEATINTEGCSYLFHVEGSGPSFNNKVDVECGAGKSIKITAGTCKVEIGGQKELKNVVSSTSGTGVLVKPSVEGITYTVTQDGFLCPFGGTGTKKDGKYTGEVTIFRVGGGSIAVS